MEPQWQVTSFCKQGPDRHHLVHRRECSSHMGRALCLIFDFVQTEPDPSSRTYQHVLTLRDHPFPVGCLAWSLDDSILLSSAEQYIKMWNTKASRVRAQFHLYNAHSAFLSDWYLYSHSRCTYGDGISTGLGTRWLRISFRFTGSQDHPLGSSSVSHDNKDAPRHPSSLHAQYLTVISLCPESLMFSFHYTRAQMVGNVIHGESLQSG